MIFMVTPLRLAVGRYRDYYLQHIKRCHFEFTVFAVSLKVGILLTGLTVKSLVAVVTQTDSPKSVRNRCVI